MSSRQFFSQTNLVPNWSFEYHTTCPYLDSQLSFATPWFLGPSTDLYDSCSTYVNVPYEYGANYDTAYAKNGHALIGGHCYWNGREYAQVKLNDTLKPNGCYFVEFFTRRAWLCDWAINCIAANLSSNSYVGYPSPLQVPMHITRYNNPVISDTSNWVQVAGIYTAVGNEKYITIGNFQIDSTTTAALVYNNNIGCSYYFFDAVSVYSINPSGVLPWTYKDTTVIAGDSVYIGNYIGGNFNPAWYTYSGNFIANNAGIYVKPTVTSQYIVQFTVCGVPRADTVKVTVANPVGTVDNSFWENISLYPNPTNGIIQLDISNKNFDSRDLIIKIFNPQAQQIKIIKVMTSKQDIVLTELPDGIYFVQLCIDNRVVTTRKMVKRQN